MTKNAQTPQTGAENPAAGQAATNPDAAAVEAAARVEAEAATLAAAEAAALAAAEAEAAALAEAARAADAAALVAAEDAKVAVNVPQAFTLRRDDGTSQFFPAGAAKMEEQDLAHWYSEAMGVRRAAV